CVCGKIPTLRAVTRKPAIAGPEERARNPRSAPAKLRVAEKLPPPSPTPNPRPQQR
ncbi:MAG: 16S rRNA (cytosine(1402)-N(4))-methyltransferase, partial [Lentisphaeria bacterium]|nr:16S rRNA (cytosine(1402)-N(4))-methyltransferase [Lentisphaeria bacterium]